MLLQVYIISCLFLYCFLSLQMLNFLYCHHCTVIRTHLYPLYWCTTCINMVLISALELIFITKFLPNSSIMQKFQFWPQIQLVVQTRADIILGHDELLYLVDNSVTCPYSKQLLDMGSNPNPHQKVGDSRSHFPNLGVDQQNVKCRLRRYLIKREYKKVNITTFFSKLLYKI